MASTNKTTNYDLSQYIGTDKPTYLTDYNQDMIKIDTGIHSAKSQAETNSSAIGTLTELDTDVKTDIVSAVNEVVGDVATNTNNIATNTSNIATNTTHIGTVANLTTTAKTDLVVATNEVNAKVGNLGNLTTTEKSSTVGAINEVKAQSDSNKTNIEKFNFTKFKNYSANSDFSTTGCSVTTGIASNGITIATNEDGSICKIYGAVRITKTDQSSVLTLSNTGLAHPSSDITINTAGIELGQNDCRTVIIIKTNGNVELRTYGASAGTNVTLTYFPCVYFVKDFGDVAN